MKYIAYKRVFVHKNPLYASLEALYPRVRVRYRSFFNNISNRFKQVLLVLPRTRNRTRNRTREQLGV